MSVARLSHAWRAASSCDTVVRSMCVTVWPPISLPSAWSEAIWPLGEVVAAPTRPEMMKNVPCIPCEARIGAAAIWSALPSSKVSERSPAAGPRARASCARGRPPQRRRPGSASAHQDSPSRSCALPPAGDRRANRPVHRADQIARRHPVEDLDTRERAPHAGRILEADAVLSNRTQESRHQDFVEEPGHRRVVRRDPVRREGYAKCVGARQPVGREVGQRPVQVPGDPRAVLVDRLEPALVREPLPLGQERDRCRGRRRPGSGRGRRGVGAEARTARSAASPRPRPSRGSTAGAARRRP